MYLENDFAMSQNSIPIPAKKASPPPFIAKADSDGIEECRFLQGRGRRTPGSSTKEAIRNFQKSERIISPMVWQADKPEKLKYIWIKEGMINKRGLNILFLLAVFVLINAVYIAAKMDFSSFGRSKNAVVSRKRIWRKAVYRRCPGQPRAASLS